MTDIEALADAIRLAYGQAVREERPMMALHIAAEPYRSLPEDRKRKWRRMAEAAERVLHSDYADRVHRTVRTLQNIGCDPDEPCLTTSEVLRMLGVRDEATEGSNRG